MSALRLTATQSCPSRPVRQRQVYEQEEDHHDEENANKHVTIRRDLHPNQDTEQKAGDPQKPSGVCSFVFFLHCSFFARHARHLLQIIGAILGAHLLYASDT